jgi:myo-inositol-1-phosphate synthase
VNVRVALAGVGNNASALVQGVAYYRANPDAMVRLRRPDLAGLSPTDVRIAAAFDIDARKVARPLREAIHVGNVFPDIAPPLDSDGAVVVEAGVEPSDDDRDVMRVANSLVEQNADVLLLGLPSESIGACQRYARACVMAGVALVNCSPDRIARDPAILAEFESAGLPLLGDDLASQFGSSLVHRTLLELARDRGLTVGATYQINVGGNADFENLSAHADAKRDSKRNVLESALGSEGQLTIIPSGGHIPSLRDNKVAYISIEGRGWADMPFGLELRLHVQDSANAAGVIIDLLRIAWRERAERRGGFCEEAISLFKSPPGSRL